MQEKATALHPPVYTEDDTGALSDWDCAEFDYRPLFIFFATGICAVYGGDRGRVIKPYTVRSERNSVSSLVWGSWRWKRAQPTPPPGSLLLSQLLSGVYCHHSCNSGIGHMRPTLSNEFTAPEAAALSPLPPCPNPGVNTMEVPDGRFQPQHLGLKHSLRTSRPCP